jgi:hypothetical protein
MGGLSTVVVALLSLILCHVACPVVVAASTLPERHPGLPRFDVPTSYRWCRGSGCEGPAKASEAVVGGMAGAGSSRLEWSGWQSGFDGVEARVVERAGGSRLGRERTVQMRARQQQSCLCVLHGGCTAEPISHLTAGVKWRG